MGFFVVYVQPPTFWYCTGIDVIEIKTQYPTQIHTSLHNRPPRRCQHLRSHHVSSFCLYNIYSVTSSRSSMYPLMPARGKRFCHVSWRTCGSVATAPMLVVGRSEYALCA